MTRLWRDAWAIAAKDATETWRDGRFRWACAILLTILGAAFASGWSQVASTSQARIEAQRAEREMWLGKGAMNPHAAAHYGAFVFKPVEPLSVVDSGLDPFVGVSVFLEAHQQELTRHQPADDASAIRRFGHVTAAVALQVLVPLLIVLATAPAFVAERESGTLRQLMSVGVARASLTIGKTVGAAIPLALVLVPASLIGAAALMWTVPLGMSADTAARGVLLAVVYVAYFGMWAAVGLAVSARARSSMFSLAVLVGLWFTCSFVVPAVAMVASKAAAASSLTGESVRAIERARSALPRWDRRVESVEERFLTGELDLESGMPSNPEVIALVEAEEAETALYDAHFTSVFTAFDLQATAYARLGFLTPTLAVQALSMALSGTDYAHHHRFLQATSAYRRAFLSTLNAELASYEALDTFDYARGREFWERIPEFSYEAPRVGQVVIEHRMTLGATAAWLLAILGVLAWSLVTIRVHAT